MRPLSRFQKTGEPLVLRNAPFPQDIQELGIDGLRQLWRDAKLRGCGYNRAGSIIWYAEESAGLLDGTDAGKEAVRWFVEKIAELDKKLNEIETELHTKCMDIPHAENIQEISGIREIILSGILADMGDTDRFDDAKEIQKISGLGLVACSSGKHKGETRISHRGRKRLRYALFQVVTSAVPHACEFKKLHAYYTTRVKNPLKKCSH